MDSLALYHDEFFKRKLEHECEIKAKSAGYASSDEYLKSWEKVEEAIKIAFKAAKKNHQWSAVLSALNSYLKLDPNNLAIFSSLGVCFQKEGSETSKQTADSIFKKNVLSYFPHLINLDRTVSDQRKFVRTAFKANNMLIRPAFIQDLKVIEKLYATVNRSEFIESYYHLSLNIQFNGISQYWTSNKVEEVFVFQLSHSLKAKGFILLEFEHINLDSNSSKKTNTCTLETIAISQKYRRKKYGKCLMKFAKERAKNNGCSSIELECNKESLSFFFSQRFTPTNAQEFVSSLEKKSENDTDIFELSLNLS